MSEWVFEGPDPEVGIFGDLILHTCRANEDEEPAVELDNSLRGSGSFVTEVRTFRCPACGDTTETVEQIPKDWFEA